MVGWLSNLSFIRYFFLPLATTNDAGPFLTPFGLFSGSGDRKRTIKVLAWLPWLHLV
jgi:hypothetical protein